MTATPTETELKWGLDDACQHPHPFEIVVVLPGNDEAELRSQADVFVENALELVAGLEHKQHEFMYETSVVRPHLQIVFVTDAMPPSLAALAFDVLDLAASKIGGEVDTWAQLPIDNSLPPLPALNMTFSTERGGLSVEASRDGQTYFSLAMDAKMVKAARRAIPVLQQMGMFNVPGIGIILEQIKTHEDTEQH